MAGHDVLNSRLGHAPTGQLTYDHHPSHGHPDTGHRGSRLAGKELRGVDLMKTKNKFCTISCVENGWLVHRGLPFSHCNYDPTHDDMLVFIDTGHLANWVEEWFSEPEEPSTKPLPK